MAKCKANPAVCLRGIEIGGIDFFALVADCRWFSIFWYRFEKS